ncbi:hypothetical protein ACFQZB_18105 [Arthrobacter ulcerisalmonis]
MSRTSGIPTIAMVSAQALTSNPIADSETPRSALITGKSPDGNISTVTVSSVAAVSTARIGQARADRRCRAG